MCRFLILPALLALTACLGLPQAEPEQLTVEQEIAEAIGEATGAPVTESAKPKLLAFLRPKPKPVPETAADITIVTAETELPPEPETRRGLAALFSPRRAVEPAAVLAADVPAEPQTSAQSAGLFGFLRSKPTVAGATAPAELETGAEQIELAALPAETKDPATKRGLFRRLPASAPASTVAPGQVLPFGSVGVACGLGKRALGKEVDRFPKDGRASWRLYDTDPTSTGPRSQFITGFSDGCARQFTAALALFGSPGLHEIHRYGAAQKNVPYSASDKAYEKVKSNICGVGRGKPCPEARAGRLEKATSFVTVYQQFGGSVAWLEMLLHNGKMLASEVRGR